MLKFVSFTILTTLSGLISCHNPESEPQFQSYIDSAHMFAYSINGEEVEYSAQDCDWEFDEFEDVSDPYSVIRTHCGFDEGFRSHHQVWGHRFSNYKADATIENFTDFRSKMYVQNELWPWDGYYENENCVHDPGSGLHNVGDSNFSIAPSNQVAPEGFDETYEVNMMFRSYTPTLEQPCFQLEIKGGYHVKF